MPLKSFGCQICGAQAPEKYRAEGKFSERMRWLWKHRKARHPYAHRESVAKSLRARG